MKELKIKDLKQKNKPFKGSSKKKLKNKALPKIDDISKPISKQTDKKIVSKQQEKGKGKQKKGQQKKQQQNQAMQQQENNNNMIEKNQYLSPLEKAKILGLKENNLIPKIIALIPMNEGANSEIVKNNLEQIFVEKLAEQNFEQSGQLQFKFPYLKFCTDPKKFGELKKENYVFLSCNRDLQTCLDYCKVADIVVPILDCSKCNVEGMNLDPLNKANAFDEIAYDFLKALRIQGMPSVLGLIQGVDAFQGAIKQKVKHLFCRFMTSEFSEDLKCIFLEKDFATYIQFMRFLQGISFQQLQWRDSRGYMLVDTVRLNQNEIQLEGYLKGNSINPNQLVHVTGYGDFQIKQIEILENPLKTKHKKNPKKNITLEEESQQQSQQNQQIILQRNYDPTLRECLDCVHSEMQDLSHLVKEKEITRQKKQGMDLEQEEKVEQIDDEQNEQNESDINEEASDMDSKENERTEDWDKEQLIEEKNQLRLRERNQEDYEFEEEAEYPSNIILKDRFKKYCGLKNFKADWNIFKNLPENEFGRIFLFENLTRAQKKSREHYNINGFAFNGFYIRITLENGSILANHQPSTPLVVSTLFEHERKLTIVHFKVQLGLEFQEWVLKSKDQQIIQVGFRRDIVKPIYSEIYQNCGKTKYKKEIKGKNFYLASFYYHTLFTPATIIFFTPKNDQKIAFASGELHSVNPLHVILKKKILTGYPYRIQKKRAVVRLMFFNKIDVDYFTPIQLNTKLGLKGKIKESVGTHGLYKCAFNQFIKSHDTICLFLYKRVFPPWIIS